MQTTEPTDLAPAFRALADPTRLDLLLRLAQGERCVCELTDAMDAAQSRLSFHLKVLKNAGLVSDRRAGRWSYYSLEPDALAALAEFVDGLRAEALASASPGGCCG